MVLYDGCNCVMNRVQAEADVEESQWNHQEHPRGYCVQRGHHLQEHPQACHQLEETHCDWSSCIRRSGNVIVLLFSMCIGSRSYLLGWILLYESLI